jgi:hypothetical protein
MTTTSAEPTTDALVLRYTQRIDELTHAARVYQRSTRKHQVYKVLGLLAIFLAAWTFLRSGPDLGPALLLALGVFLWFDPVPLIVLGAGLRNTAAVRDPYETLIDARGTHFSIGKNRVSRGWDKYQRLLESERVFVLVFGRWAYSVIPKRVLADPAQEAALRELLRRHIGRGNK